MDAASREILLKMKARLSEGWTKGAFATENGGVCLFGALVLAGDVPRCTGVNGGPCAPGRGTPGHPDGAYVVIDGSPERHAIEALAQQAGVHWLSLAIWNDAPGRTHEDVVGLIDAALAADPVETKEEVLV